MSRRRARSVPVAVLSIAMVFGLASSATADRAQSRSSGAAGDVGAAEEAIDALTAALPGLTPVTGGGLYADVAECDGARTAAALAAEASEVLQAYGGEAGGGAGQVVVFDSKKVAKRFFKLLTNDDAEACTVATNEVGLTPLSGDATASADLTRGRLAGVNRSVTLEGTITLGPLEILETEAFVRRGTVVIRGGVGEFAGSGAGLASIINDWVKATAKKF